MNDSPETSLLCYMNWLALDGLPEFPNGRLLAIRDAGYDGVQFIEPVSNQRVKEALRSGLGVCGSGRMNRTAEVERLAQEAQSNGLECLTLHVGWGMEDDKQAATLIAAVLETSAKYSVPLYPETHRATIFQDPWRTVQFIKQFPTLRFNGDFSHCYTGTEMVYGGFERKLEFIRPVLDRVSFIHGRIGNPGCMQVDIGDGNPEQHPYIRHFRALWTQAFIGFLRNQPEKEAIYFVPELLGPSIYYARTFQGREESDRWRQSLLLVEIAQGCFQDAKKQLS